MNPTCRMGKLKHGLVAAPTAAETCHLPNPHAHLHTINHDGCPTTCCTQTSPSTFKHPPAGPKATTHCRGWRKQWFLHSIVSSGGSHWPLPPHQHLPLWLLGRWHIFTPNKKQTNEPPAQGAQAPWQRGDIPALLISFPVELTRAKQSPFFSVPYSSEQLPPFLSLPF